MKTILMLHPANCTPGEFKQLVGPLPGYNLLYPQASNSSRWDHLGGNDATKLKLLGGDYICGYSSGAFMALRMCQERQYEGALIVAGGILRAYKTLLHPTPTTFVHGTADVQVPYAGSQYVMGAYDSAVKVKQALKLGTAVQTRMENTTPDGCRTTVHDWGGKVRLYSVISGGHTWPGSKWNLAPEEVGRTSYDWSLSDLIPSIFP